MAVVYIPSLMRRLTNGVEKVRVSGMNLRQVIDALEQSYPGMRAELLDAEGQIKPGVAVAIDGETTHMGLLEPVRDESEVHFIPAIGGG